MLTQEHLAERSGLSVRTVRRLESDDPGRLRISSLELLATALDLTDPERAVLVASARTPTDPVSPPPLDDVPRQLPAPSQAFTGREAELADLDRVRDASAVVITSIDGMAGIGKTALAVHAAHRFAGRYPDGQLFLDLHGYTEGVAPVESDEALARLLGVLGVPGERIPLRPDDRAALYRSRLAGRKVLILLDNAAGEAQVAPLLPGTPGCLVMVTSRRRLPGLDTSHTLSLDLLPQRDAVALFTGLTGDDGVVPAQLAEVVELCDRLPLAIRIAAARLRARPAWTVAHLIERLRDHRGRLGELEAGLRSVTATLDLSYRQLGPRERRAFRLLGVHPGGDLDTYAATALIGSTPAEAERSIGELLEAHLVQEPTPGRYRFHDLVRAYAAAEGTAPDRVEALTRLLDHYCHTASSAMDVAHPYERGRRPVARPAGTPSPALGDETAAIAWLDVELPNLLAAARLAADHGWPDHLRHLSTTLHRHLRTRWRYAEAEALHERALSVARASGDRQAEAEALVGLGHMHRLQGRPEPATESYRLGRTAARAGRHRPMELEALIFLGHMDRHQHRYEAARACFEEGLEIAVATGDRVAEMEALLGLGWVRLACEQDARDEFERALDLARALGHRIGEGTALQAVGYVHRLHSRFDQAAEAFEQSLELARAISSPYTELSALVDLARLHRLSGGRAEQAADCYRQVLDLTRESSSPAHEANAWYGLGRLHHAAGRVDDALVHHRRALDLATELKLPGLQAQAHDGLAHAHAVLDQRDRAREHWTDALDILTGLAADSTLDDVTAEAVRACLDRPAETGP